MKLIISALAALIVSGTGSSAEEWSVTKTCATSSALVEGQPQLRINESAVGDKRIRSIQIFSNSQLSGSVENIRVTAGKLNLEGLKGTVAASGDSRILTIPINENWDVLLNRMALSQDLAIEAGPESVSIPLVGSAAAVASFKRCAG